MKQDTHANHAHTHGNDCGHKRIAHEGHEDFLHDGHLHHVRGDKIEEHVIAINSKNPGACTPDHGCEGHDEEHMHGPRCGHDAVPHGDHVDYLVEGHLHHPCDEHCD